MPIAPPENEFLFKTGDLVKIGIDLPDMTFAEDMATVVFSDNGELVLELCGEGLPRNKPLDSGAKVLISKGEGHTLCQGVSRLKRLERAKTVIIDVPKRVVVRERREYMRMDVAVPLNYSLPQSQNMANVIAEWERSKECDENCHEKEPPLSAEERFINLSGSGLRFKIREYLAPGTLIHVKIALHGEKPDHVHVVGAIIRTNELRSERNHVEGHSTAMSFRMITGSDRQKLVRHILDEQRKSLLLTT